MGSRSHPNAQDYYRPKLNAIGRGGAMTLTAGQFVHYLLSQKGKQPEWLDQTFGYFGGYTRRMLWHTRLAEPVVQKMAVLTGKTRDYWQRSEFSSSEVAGIEFCEGVDVHMIGTTGGSHAARVARIAASAAR